MSRDLIKFLICRSCFFVTRSVGTQSHMMGGGGWRVKGGGRMDGGGRMEGGKRR